MSFGNINSIVSRNLRLMFSFRNDKNLFFYDTDVLQEQC